jgi:hypothetical protein
MLVEQAVATSGASSLPESFRFAPGGGCSPSAAGRLAMKYSCPSSEEVQSCQKILLARSSSPLQDWRRSVDCCNDSGIVEVHARAGMTPGMVKTIAALDGGTEYVINLIVE